MPEKDIIHSVFVPGSEPALVFLHGLGASGSCFRGALDAPELSGRALLLPDLAGFGSSPEQDGRGYSMQAQADRVQELCGSLGLKQIALVGHSMGGAVGILLAERLGTALTHFVNAVGNLVPADCFFSRAIVAQGRNAFSATGFDHFKNAFREVTTPAGRGPSSYLQSLEQATAEAMFASSQDLVRLCDQGRLLDRFLALPCSRVYLHDADNRVAQVIEQRLRSGGVPLLCIPNTGHGLMEENPARFYPEVAHFLERGFRWIDCRDPIYGRERALRFEVLRKPLGMAMLETFPFEEQSLHLVAIEGQEVVGCVLFHPQVKSGRLYQMAVSASCQGRGLGRQLVWTLEQRLRAEGFEHVWLHARVPVIGFYERLGYRIDSEAFLEIGIEHRRMIKDLSVERFVEAPNW